MDLDWMAGAVTFFTLLFIFLADIGLFLIKTRTISDFMVDYFGGKKYYYRIFIFGFIVGGLVVHFSKWHPYENGTKTDSYHEISNSRLD